MHSRLPQQLRLQNGVGTSDSHLYTVGLKLDNPAPRTAAAPAPACATSASAKSSNAFELCPEVIYEQCLDRAAAGSAGSLIYYLCNVFRIISYPHSKLLSVSSSGSDCSASSVGSASSATSVPLVRSVFVSGSVAPSVGSPP